jgi:DNA-binding FadR family transcriptional regulator
MKRYERLASQIGDLIQRGDLPPGTRIPAVRAACDAYGVSPSTVFRAYYLLESQGLIVARPRSGYFVSAAAPGAPLHGAASTPNEPSKSVNISELVFEVLHSIRTRIPWHSARHSRVPRSFRCNVLEGRAHRSIVRLISQKWWPHCRLAMTHCVVR